MPSPVLTPDNTVVIPVAMTGRTIAYTLLKVIAFWGHHRSTLAPWIDGRLTAVLDDLANAVLLVQQMIRPGPE